MTNPISSYTFRYSCIFALFLIIGLLAIPTMSCTQDEEDQAQAAITDAQAAINSAVAVLIQADFTGADISDLIILLNSAIDELRIARAAFNLTDYSSAIQYAQNANALADQVSEDAHFRHFFALQNSVLQIGTIFIVILFVAGLSYSLFLYWTKREKQQRTTLLRMEIRLPEKENEEKSDA